MPAIEIPKFILPDDAKTKNKKSPSEMVDAAFLALIPWFAGIIPVIEKEWQRGATAGDDRTKAELKLGGLAGQVNTMKDLLQGYVNEELGAKPIIDVKDFTLPDEATTKNDDKVKDKTKLVIAPVMSAKTFQALTPWFKGIIEKIKPYYKASATASNSQLDTSVRLGGLAGQVNVMKDLLQRYVNREIAKKESNAGFSESNEEEAEIAPNVAFEILNYMDVKVGENEPVDIIEDVSVELGEIQD